MRSALGAPLYGISLFANPGIAFRSAIELVLVLGSLLRCCLQGALIVLVGGVFATRSTPRIDNDDDDVNENDWLEVGDTVPRKSTTPEEAPLGVRSGAFLFVQEGCSYLAMTES